MRRAHVIETSRVGLARPAGLAWSRRAGGFLVLPRGSRRGLHLLTHEGRRVRRPGLPFSVADPLNATFDNKAHRLVHYDARRQQLVALSAGRDGIPDPGTLSRSSLRQYGIREARGLTADPVTGRLFLLDAAGPEILVIEPDPDGDLRRSRVHAIAPEGLALGGLRGLAFDPASGHLHVFDPVEERLYEIDDHGAVVANRDLSGLGLSEPQAMTFAPSTDSTDDPLQTSLFVAESGGKSGQISELSFSRPAAPGPRTR